MSILDLGEEHTVETSTLTIGTAQGQLERQLRYLYDDAGRLTHIYYNNHLLASYAYDGAGRLVHQTVHPLGTNATLTAGLTYAE